LIRETGMDALQINSNLPVASDRVKGKAVRVSQVEMELGSCGVTQEKGLSTWTAPKPQLLRLSTKVAREDVPQDAAPGHELLPVSRKAKAGGAGSFVGRKRLLEAV
jgi:hypothetical protein